MTLTPAPRIIGGSESTPHSFPFVLSLKSWGHHVCGAGLLSATWAVTAAHCIDEYASHTQYSVDVHRHDLGRSHGDDHACAQLVTAASLHPHADYDKATHDNDIALIHLSTPVRCAGNIPMLVPDDGSVAAGGTGGDTDTGTGSADSDDKKNSGMND